MADGDVSLFPVACLWVGQASHPDPERVVIQEMTFSPPRLTSYSLMAVDKSMMIRKVVD